MPNTLQDRLLKARAAIQQYPEWVSFNTRFEGGESSRELTKIVNGTTKKAGTSNLVLPQGVELKSF